MRKFINLAFFNIPAKIVVLVLVVINLIVALSYGQENEKYRTVTYASSDCIVAADSIECKVLR